jgi:hypothetical protein
MNSNSSNPFPLYNANTQTSQPQLPPGANTQRQQQFFISQQQQRQLYPPQQQQLLDSEQARLQHQQLQNSHAQHQVPYQYSPQQVHPQYLQYQQPRADMNAAVPMQQQNAAGFYAHQQMDVQSRLAHLQLQHPPQPQRPGRRTPSPTRQGPQVQQYSYNPNRVLITRNTSGFSRSTLDRAEATRVKLEHLYKVSVEQAVERNQRCRSSYPRA